MIVVVLLVVVAVISLLAGAHWYLWRRLVRDTTENRAVRRTGAVVLVVLPLLSVATMVSARSGAPFWLEQVLAWPGYLWLALLLYLVLFLVAGEVVRAVWLRRVKRAERDPAPGSGADSAGTAGPSGPSGPSGLSGDPSPAPSPAAAARRESTTTALVMDPVDGTGRPATESGAATARVSATADDPATLPGPDSDPAVDASRTRTQTEPEPQARTTAPDPAPAGAAPPAPAVSRRLFVSRVVGGSAAAAALATVGYGTYGVLRGPRVKRVTVPLAKLPRAAHGFRIAVVSDIHLGPILGRAHTQRIVDSINSTRPDLVAVVGDMVDGEVADLGSAAEPLAQLEARHGSFFVTGNHEYFSGAEQWLDHVRELGLRPLENERAEIPGGFDLAGVDDVEGESEGKGPDFEKALGDRDRTRASVLLAHQPVVIHDAVKHGVDLQLSGHTHGGQLWPGNYLAELANPTVAGLERYGDTQLYVTRGAGAWGPPVRVGAASDITVVQLASRQA
ncbi:metallophosphoesterase [Streptomyces sp. NPDC051018]|uniref:metallophosphoesterase n=1 Tax=Streptomyces sp. NPDC051018 TaxID=3365639 RepID=UPI00378B2302